MPYLGITRANNPECGSKKLQLLLAGWTFYNLALNFNATTGGCSVLFGSEHEQHGESFTIAPLASLAMVTKSVPLDKIRCGNNLKRLLLRSIREFDESMLLLLAHGAYPALIWEHTNGVYPLRVHLALCTHLP